MTTKCYQAKTGELEAKWYVVDATDKILGRMAVRIATILMGKHRPQYTPHVDTGEFVIVINAEKIKLTGDKWAQKTYDWYTKYPGGFKSRTAAEMMAQHPDNMVKEAVRRMLPKTKMGMHMLTKLKVYAGDKHPHQAQQPQELKL
jgi:large subunit ribosomal protein L13